ncbi:hypothetical protein FOA52_010968 [Chlamydomonas sp. UWO 241]|nr:hypothetical protein FOA52_010968 [Chlamydomonas sp. UWO 241]
MFGLSQGQATLSSFYTDFQQFAFPSSILVNASGYSIGVATKEVIQNMLVLIGLPSSSGSAGSCASPPSCACWPCCRRSGGRSPSLSAAERIAAAAEDGTSLRVRLATDVVRFLYGGTGRREPADGGVVSASLLNAKPAVGGIGVEPRGGGVLRVLFTVASDAVADTVVRWHHELRRCVDSLQSSTSSVTARRRSTSKVAGKRAQFHRARLVVDGERVPAPAC